MIIQIFYQLQTPPLSWFQDGAVAWDAKDYLIEQEGCEEVTIEQKAYPGKHSEKGKEEAAKVEQEVKEKAKKQKQKMEERERNKKKKEESEKKQKEKKKEDKDKKKEDKKNKKSKKDKSEL